MMSTKVTTSSTPFSRRQRGKRQREGVPLAGDEKNLGRDQTGAWWGRWRHSFTAFCLENWVLTASLVVGFVLRVCTLTWGLPLTSHSDFYHPDESKSWRHVVDFPDCYWNNTNFIYGTSIPYLLGVVLYPVKSLMVTKFDAEAAYTIVAVLAFRFTTVLLGTWAIALAWKLVKKLRFDQTANVAAMLLAVSPFHCVNSSLTTLDVAMSCFALLAMLQTIRSFESMSQVEFAKLGVVIGLLATTKVTGLLFGVVPALFTAKIAFEQITGRRVYRVQEVLACIIMTIVTAIVTVIVTMPHVIFFIGEYLQFMRQQKYEWHDRLNMSLIATLREWVIRTCDTLGWPVAVCFIVGMVAWFRRLSWSSVAIIAFIAVNYFFWQGYLLSRFLIVVVPFACCIGAAFGERLLSNRFGKILLAGALGYSVFWCGVGIAQRWFDVRTRASAYIDANLPAGTTVGIATETSEISPGHHGWRYPRIDWTKFTETKFLDRPEYLIATAFELDVLEPALHSPLLDRDYVWDPTQVTQWYEYRPPTPDVFRFYADLLAERDYELVQRFRPVSTMRYDGAAREVRIYRLRK